MKQGTPAQRKLGFRIHAIAFASTIALLLVINFLTGPPWWVQWVVLGWGIGLVSHGFVVRGFRAGKASPTRGLP